MWKRIERLAAPLGMVGAAFYFAHTIEGRLMWVGYNPITTDISSLTADGAPNAPLLRVLTVVYAACMIAFSGAMTLRAFRSFGRVLRAGYVLLFTMELISASDTRCSR